MRREPPRRGRRAVVAAALVAFIALAAGCAQPAGEDLSGAVTFARSSGRAIDLYTVELADGRLERHTRGPGTSTSPSWSPDGSRLAFARRVGPPYNLWVLDADSGTVTRLTEGQAIDGHPTWSPDGSRLAFASNRVAGPAFAVHVVDRDGTGLREVSTGRSPAWAPAGTAVAFERAGDLLVVDVDTGGERRLTEGLGSATAPAWSPDGTRLVFARTDDEGGLHVVEADGGGVRRLTADPGDGAPAWSPDGRFVAFARHDDAGSDLHVVEVATGRVQRITDSPLSDVAPTWRPDR